jgi:hypothetical protein
MDELNKEWQVEKAQIKEAKDLKAKLEKAKFDLSAYFTNWQLRKSFGVAV